MDFHRNNLDKAASPYLRQHKENPIHWQEWSPEVLEHTRLQKKLLFVSVGYATCHWCHVMAAEAFNDSTVAAFLNTHFISIKVDREQRPDIDQFLMSYLVETSGQGGWPLNAVLTPDLKPVIAATYLPVKTQMDLPGIVDFLRYAQSVWEDKGKNISRFSVPSPEHGKQEEGSLAGTILSAFDRQYGGFGRPKFPPHNTLLFLLSVFEKTKDSSIKTIIEKTLDQMAMRGLNDHLQGGFYRYCVDNAWTVPHFEKMLYDQVMLLWVYSAAYKVLEKEAYKTIAEKIVRCLSDTFQSPAGLYYAGHDADTNHKEGETYLWTKKEIEDILSVQERKIFFSLYNIHEQGNVEGKNHLIKSELKFIPIIEKKLLRMRMQRLQPETDKKIVASWNALAGMGLLMAWRCLGDKKTKVMAEKIYDIIIKNHYRKGKMSHSSFEGQLQQNDFLEDYASVLLLACMLQEEEKGDKYIPIIEKLTKKLNMFFRNGVWVENSPELPQPAPAMDHPGPSPASLAEMALFRAQLALSQQWQQREYKSPLNYDFWNLLAFTQRSFHILHSPVPLPWPQLPLNAIQLRGPLQDCYRQKCRIFTNENELLINLK